MKPSQATLVLRIPLSLHRRLKQEARAAEISLNKHCRALLSRRTGDCSSQGSPVSPSLSAFYACRTAPLQDLSASVLDTWGSDIEALALFGSFARGRETESSDIDLLVVLSGNVTLDRDIYSRWHLCEFGGRAVAPLFVQIPGQGERIGGLWFEVALDGMVLFDRDLRLSRFLSHVRDLVAGGQVRRMITHGHPYWVHSDQASRHPSSAGGS